ncbi:MAG: glycosyltransferase [Magnetococcales bacterium]|nr:glycosyltransferase [Magnetococcales bacterium]
MDSPYLSVIVPGLNVAATLEACLASVSAALPPGETAEVLFADGGSQDDSPAIAARAGSRLVSVSFPRGFRISRLRNQGAAQAHGELLCFLDADMTLPPEALSLACGRFRQGFDGLLAFQDQAPPHTSWVGRVWGARDLLPQGEVVSARQLPGRNLFIRRVRFQQLGGFSEELPTGEDKAFSVAARQAGLPVLRSAETTLIHHGAEGSLGEFLGKEYWRQSHALGQLATLGLSPRTLRQPLFALWHLLLPPATVLLLPFSPTAALLLLLLWPLPALLSTAVFFRRARVAFWPLAALNFLRWSVAGVALAGEVRHRFRGSGP